MHKILIAEDNDMNLKLMSDVLGIHGYFVESAQNGEIAVEKLTSQKYDLLLLDLQMPVVSGFDVLEFLKKNKISVKVIVVSACAMSDEIEKAKALGCVDFISKPIRINEFLSTIKAHCL